MNRRNRMTRGGVTAPLIAIVLLVAVAGSAVAALGTHRPHMGATANDVGTVWWDPIRNYQNGWSVFRWGGCRTVVRWYIETNVPAGWHTAISNGVQKWDNSAYCGPDFVKTTSAGAARLKFRVEDDKYCGYDGVKVWYAIACRNYAASSTDQVWTIAFNDTDANFAVGSSGTFDVESIVVNEMGHVLYVDHNTGWTDGTVQANSCTWGATSCRVTSDMGFSDFAEYWVNCNNCGSRRSVLTGDWATVQHIYGTYGNPCTGVCPNAAGEKSSGKGRQPDPGPLSPEAIAAELEAQNPNSTMEFMRDEHLLAP